MTTPMLSQHAGFTQLGHMNCPYHWSAPSCAPVPSSFLPNSRERWPRRQPPRPYPLLRHSTRSHPYPFNWH